jgi:hypothetical protein
VDFRIVDLSPNIELNQRFPYQRDFVGVGQKNSAALVDSKMTLLSSLAWSAHETNRTADGVIGNKTENQKPSRKAVFR